MFTNIKYSVARKKNEVDSQKSQRDDDQKEEVRKKLRRMWVCSLVFLSVEIGQMHTTLLAAVSASESGKQKHGESQNKDIYYRGCSLYNWGKELSRKGSMRGVEGSGN